MVKLQKWLIIAPIALCVAIVLLAVALFHYVSQFEKIVLEQQQREAVLEATITADILSELISAGKMDEALDYCKNFKSTHRITLIDTAGTPIVDSVFDVKKLKNHNNRREIQDAFAGTPTSNVRYSKTAGELMAYSAVPVKVNGITTHVLRLSMTLDEIGSTSKHLRYGLYGAVFLGFAGAILFVFLLTLALHEKLRNEDMKRYEAFRSDFIANVSHEIKTPLTAILSGVETLQENFPAENRKGVVPRILTILGQQSRRLSALVKDILSLAELERRQQEENLAPTEYVDLTNIVESAIDLAKSGSNFAGTINFAPKNQISIRGDAQLLEQLIINLLNNAIKYSQSEKIDVGLIKSGNAAELSVRDYGIGIPAEHLQRLFERFYRVDKAHSRAIGGTGLGLAIVKHVAQLHGGNATVESEWGHGTCFTIKFPID